jgi:hypothetical protein
MDMDQLNLLPNTAKDKYMAYQRLFDQPFYQELVNWVKSESQEAAQRALGSLKWEDFVYARGQQLAFEKVANLETIVENEFAAIAHSIGEQQKELDEEDGSIGDNE